MATDRRLQEPSPSVAFQSHNPIEERETMRSHSLLCVLGACAGLALAGCASNAGNHRQYEKSTDVAPGDAELMSYRIRTWSAPNDHTVVFESMDGTRYRAETLGPCNGLDFAPKLGFQN